MMKHGHALSRVARQRRKVFGLLMLGSFAMAFAASPFGCGLDDSALQQVGSVDGSFTDTGAQLTEAGQPIGDASPDAKTCVAETCNNYPSICRMGLDDGCGSTINCLTCPGDQKCIPDSGTCDGPPVCHDAGEPGGNCETIINTGNGIEAGCGECSGGYACTSSTCQCAGTACGAGNATCCLTGSANPNCNTTAGTCCKQKNPLTDCAGSCSNAVDNGCGGTMDCSNSCGTMQCNPSNKMCCTPDSTATSCGTKCNTMVMNNCNNLTNCPATCANGDTCSGTTCTCASGKMCGAACCAAASNVCNASNNCCVPDPLTTTCAGNKCGMVVNNCGQTVACGQDGNGQCETPEVCSGTANCTCHTQTCTPGQACCGPDGAHVCKNGGTCN